MVIIFRMYEGLLNLKMAEKQGMNAFAEASKGEEPTYCFQRTGLTVQESYLSIIKVC